MGDSSGGRIINFDRPDEVMDTPNNINSKSFKDALVDEVFSAPLDALFELVSDSGSSFHGGEEGGGEEHFAPPIDFDVVGLEGIKQTPASLQVIGGSRISFPKPVVTEDNDSAFFDIIVADPTARSSNPLSPLNLASDGDSGPESIEGSIGVNEMESKLDAKWISNNSVSSGETGEK
ncbi:hypothetical protein SUGI_0495160 [Cryptomeria japonica]|nr:hypothetical protein SUGI_0495160 [Cryptomeria japonica]